MAEATKQKEKKPNEFYSVEPEAAKEPKEGEPEKGTTKAFAFNAADVISAECEVGDKAPGDPCNATLQLSTDGENFVDVSRKSFGYLQPAKTYRVAWSMAEFETGSSPQIVSPLLSGGWEQARIKFTGAENVTITAHSALGVKEAEKPKKAAPVAPHGHAAHK